MLLEVFFDYSCPFCYRGHKTLMELLPAYEGIEIVWRPCEAHPRPETYGPHSDLCARAMFFAEKKKADLTEVHRTMYESIFEGRMDIEDPAAIAEALKVEVNQKELFDCLQGDAFVKELSENNRLTWESHGFAAVPSFSAGDKYLEAVPMRGLTKQMMKEFLDTL